MQLLAAILGWVLKRALAFAAILLVLFGGYLVIALAVPEFTSAFQTEDQLAEVRKDRAAADDELKAKEEDYGARVEAAKTQALGSMEERTRKEVDSLSQELKKKSNEVTRLQEALCDDWATFWEDAWGTFGMPKPCELAEAAAQGARDSRRSLSDGLSIASERLETLQDPELTEEQKLQIVGLSQDEFGEPLLQSEITDLKQKIEALKTDEEGLVRAQESWVWFVIEQWRERWVWVVGGALAVFLLPPLTRVFNYFVAMPLMTRAAKPVRLSRDEEAASARIDIGPAMRSLTISLTQGEVLSARAQHLRDVQGTPVKGQLLYDWTAPFVSFAAGLHGLSRVSPNEGVAQMTISDPEASDSYVMRIDFRNHPGLAMHPRHVVGVIGAPRVKTRWRWGWHFLATGQARYILFTGSGSLLVQGIGDIVAPIASGDESKMEQNLVMGFDSRLTVSIRRTENFISYYQGKEPLVDKVFSGPHPYFWQKTATGGTKTAIERGFGFAFSAIGKVMGF